MKKIFILCFVIISSKSMIAQEPSNNSLPEQGVVESAPAQMTAQDSLKQSISQIKNAFTDINKLLARKRDTMSIVVSDIDYDNINLAQLKDNLKKVKGVRSVDIKFNGTTATMEIAYKGEATNVWDSLPVTTKSAFKVSEIGDKNIKLSYKQKIP